MIFISADHFFLFSFFPPPEYGLNLNYLSQDTRNIFLCFEKALQVHKYLKTVDVKLSLNNEYYITK